ncbi:hypothetical protein [Hyphobacterium sp.]|uniref:hypothetical protein n=1 Tax=Hyphobacterium sp. TaxID=2004662 RepID=UPI003BAA567B
MIRIFALLIIISLAVLPSTAATARGLSKPPTVSSYDENFDDWLQQLETRLAPSDSRLLAQSPELGIYPGDIVIGNLTESRLGPGHAGIYIGRWRDLPDHLQEDYAAVLDRALIRSQDWGLIDSYLVIDSMPSGGVMVRSFVEQFTGYLVRRSQPRIEDAVIWEANTGGAIAWPGLANEDPRRWQIVEEALSAALHRVPYDDNHTQWATTRLFGYEGLDYDQFDDGLDCIALIHIAYQRGADIDLDVSWAPWHTPAQIYDEAAENGYLRQVDLTFAQFEMLFQGVWRLDQTDLHIDQTGAAGEHLRALLTLPSAEYRLWRDDNEFFFRFPADAQPLPDIVRALGWVSGLERLPDGSLLFSLRDPSGSFDLYGTVDTDGEMRIEISGDIRAGGSWLPTHTSANSAMSGRYQMFLEGRKMFSMPQRQRREDLGLVLSPVTRY